MMTKMIKGAMCGVFSAVAFMLFSSTVHFVDGALWCFRSSCLDATFWHEG